MLCDQTQCCHRAHLHIFSPFHCVKIFHLFLTCFSFVLSPSSFTPITLFLCLALHFLCSSSSLASFFNSVTVNYMLSPDTFLFSYSAGHYLLTLPPKKHKSKGESSKCTYPPPIHKGPDSISVNKAPQHGCSYSFGSTVKWCK